MQAMSRIREGAFDTASRAAGTIKNRDGFSRESVRYRGDIEMSLSNLTSAAAVIRALDEYDLMGRDAFLAKYGFGRARSYFVVRDGRSYDSKAVAGAAHGFEHPDQGPLKPSDFSGGDETVR